MKIEPAREDAASGLHQLTLWVCELLLRLAGALLTLLYWPVGAQATHSDCNKFDPATQIEYLACVANNVKGIRSERGLVFEASLQQDLSRLSQTLGYVGQSSDLDALRELSSRLKASPQDNQDAITVLDNAISAHRDELRSVVSPATLQPDPELDQYVGFVQKKLKYLLSDTTMFYDGGPFEIITRSNLAVALQEAYFLNRDIDSSEDAELKRRLEATVGLDRTGWLIRSLAILDDVIARLTSADHDYLPLAFRKNSVNDFRYRRAVVLLLLKEKSLYIQALRFLAIANQDFSLTTSEIDHVYIYKLFYTPYKLRVLAETDALGHTFGSPQIDDPNVIKKLFNPAQLALASCSVRDSRSEDPTLQLSQLVGGLALSDYYVVIASANDRPTLEKLLIEIQSTIRAQNESRSGLEARVKQLEVTGFSQEISDGARVCGVTEDVAKNIFEPFSFQTSLLRMENFGRFKFHLITGGRLNADQARAVASFFNGVPELQRIIAGSMISSAYIARMKVGE